MQEIKIIRQFLSESEESTFEISQLLGSVLRGGDNIALTGNLGAGKTRMAQGIAKGAGLGDEYYIASPTFTLINEHHLDDLIYYHMDLYRLGESDELIELDFFEIIRSGNITVCEWWDLFPETIPPDALIIEILKTSETTRTIMLKTAAPDAWNSRLSKAFPTT